MREILFRGKTYSTQQSDGEDNLRSDDNWVYGTLEIQDGETDVNGNKNLDYLIHGRRGEVDYISNPETLGEYTGIYDKNGKKIFEGDILRANNGHIGYVIFRYGHFVKECSCHYKAFRLYGDNETVIGNIYDNPELLEEAQNNA